MKLKTLIGAAAASVIIGAALSASAAGNRHVNGNWMADFGGGPLSFSTNAVEHKNGAVTGSVMWSTVVMGTNSSAAFPGGDKAYVCGAITGGTKYDEGFRFHMTKYVDNGEGKNAPTDSTSPMFISATALDCADAPLQSLLSAFEHLGAVTSGNIQVKD